MKRKGRAVRCCGRHHRVLRWRTKGELQEDSSMSHSLAVRAAGPGSLESLAGSSLTRVREVLDSLASRDVNGEVLTAVRYFPAREAQWAEFPAWVHGDLVAAYGAKGI